MTSMDAVPLVSPQPPREVRAVAADELVRSLVAAGVSLLAGLALLWALSHTADIARGASRLARWAAADPPGPPPEYWDMLPGLHRDIRRFESGGGRMAPNPGGASE